MVNSLSGIDPHKVTNAQLLNLLVAIRSDMRLMAAHIDAQNEELAAVKQQFKDYRDEQKDMLSTWTTAKGVLQFIKFLAAIGIPATAIIGILKLTHKI